MNSSITEKEKIWDEFLARWPLEKLGQITLQEYTQAEDTDCFTYWLEAKTEKLGFIRGGSSFKFGETAEKAFEQMRTIVVEIANAAHRGNLGVIQQANLWAPRKTQGYEKIAFSNG